MQHFVEYVRLKVQQGREDEFLRNRPGAVAAIAEKFPDFVGAPVNARVGDHEWVDVWIYVTKEEADAAMAQSGDIPGFMAYASLAEIVNIEVGWMPAGTAAAG